MSIIRRNIPNLFTAGNLLGGILAIVFSLTGRIEIAPYFIFASAIFDFLDGFVARLLKVQSELGKQLDSLADMVTFGVAPGIIMFVLLRAAISANGMESKYWLAYFAFLIPVFAMFRLAKFNLDTRQSDAFIGLPTPAMTIFFVAFPLIMNAGSFNSVTEIYFISLVGNPITLIILILLMSILMVVELPLFALKFKNFGWKGNEIRYIFLTISIVLLATLFWWALPLIILLYIALSIINNLFNKPIKDEIQS